MPTETIDLFINGEPRQTTAVTLADFIATETFGDARIATALNGIFVPVRDRAAKLLQPGDRIEILSARQGG
jgi:sulfur carrier protein